MRAAVRTVAIIALALLGGCTFDEGQPLGEVQVQVRARHVAPAGEWHRLASGEEARITSGAIELWGVDVVGDEPADAPADPHAHHLTVDRGSVVATFGRHATALGGDFQPLPCASEHCEVAADIHGFDFGIQQLILRGDVRAPGGAERPFEITLDGPAIPKVDAHLPVDVHHRPVVEARLSLDLTPAVLDLAQDLRVLTRGAFEPAAAAMIDVQVERRKHE